MREDDFSRKTHVALLFMPLLGSIIHIYLGLQFDHCYKCFFSAANKMFFTLHQGKLKCSMFPWLFSSYQHSSTATVRETVINLPFNPTLFPFNPESPSPSHSSRYPQLPSPVPCSHVHLVGSGGLLYLLPMKLRGCPPPLNRLGMPAGMPAQIVHVIILVFILRLTKIMLLYTVTVHMLNYVILLYSTGISTVMWSPLQ